MVFCRNLLIYLHADAKRIAMDAVRRLLASGGTLVVGHAEAAIAREHGFAPIGGAGAFAFAEAVSRPAPHAVLDRRDGGRVGSRPPRSPEPKGAGARSAGAPEASAAPGPADVESALSRAGRLADAGHLQEALEMCREHLALLPGSADGHFLMGVLHDAEGRRRLAVSCFRKALYLDPSHLGALHHLALKYETSGDAMAAELLRARARRARDRSGSE